MAAFRLARSSATHIPPGSVPGRPRCLHFTGCHQHVLRNTVRVLHCPAIWQGGKCPVTASRECLQLDFEPNPFSLRITGKKSSRLSLEPGLCVGRILKHIYSIKAAVSGYRKHPFIDGSSSLRHEATGLLGRAVLAGGCRSTGLCPSFHPDCQGTLELGVPLTAPGLECGTGIELSCCFLLCMR